MLKQFESNILKNELFTKKDKLLLAISGGADSVVLAHLLKQTGYVFSLAHCNFKLRGKESDGDERFCKNLAEKLNVKIRTVQFETEAYRKKNKLGVQMAARDLRYNWFKKIMEEEGATVILTAHNAGDAIETFFVNLLRGTGIKGLRGIPEINGVFVRPLLLFKKEEILAFAEKNKIVFREDSSNREDKYERNFIRLNIIPQLKKLNPAFEDTMLGNISRLKEEYLITQQYLDLKKEEICSEKKGVVLLKKDVLKKENNLLSLLHVLLSPYGFNTAQAEDLKEIILRKGLPGKVFYSKDHVLTIERDFISITKKEKDWKDHKVVSLKAIEEIPFLKAEKIKVFIVPQKNELIIDPALLVFPLTIRKKITGDKFKPFGMKGFKLLSDFLKDEKISNYEKNEVKLLVNGNNEIIWVMGYRSDGRYKTDRTKNNLLKLTYVDEGRTDI